MGVGFYENRVARLHGIALHQIQSGEIARVFRAGDFENGRRKVDDVSQRFLVTLWLHLSRPADKHRGADPAFVGGELCAVAVMGEFPVPAVVGEV